MEHSSGGIPSHTTSNAAGAAVATEFNTIASISAPTWLIGSLPPNLSEYPLRTRNWSFKFSETKQVWILDMLNLASIKAALTNFGFVYWKDLFIEFYHPIADGAQFVAVSGIGGWTYKRQLNSNLVQTMPTASSYVFQPGTAVRIQCPFGGLISPLVSSKPLVGDHAVFAMDFHAGNIHPFMPVVKEGGQSVLEQPDILAIDPRVLRARLHGTLVCGAPLPGIFGIS